MKKIIAILMACLFALSFTIALAESENALSIVCTTFPQYDWVRQILGDRADDVDLTLLLDNGVDLHSYQPTADDIIKIAQSDLFLYVGGESDGWVEDVLATAQNPNLKTVNMLESVEAKEEETVEGMQEEEHDHDHGEEFTEEDIEDRTLADLAPASLDKEGILDMLTDHEHEVEYDEHVWLSLRNAEKLTQTIADALGELDPDNAAVYQENAGNYIAQLSELDNQYKDAVTNGQRTTILFADRFPFRYLADDYGLTYYAAFVGCSAETEASFETIAFLAKKVDELKLPVVLTIEGDNHSIAKTVASSTQEKNQKILVMNSLQSVTANDIADGESYLGIMTENLEVLKEALS